MVATDPTLVEAWVRARSIARNIPQPVADHGGWRVESSTPTEVRRYVFATPCEGLRDLAATIHDPGVVLNSCEAAPKMRASLTPEWIIDAPCYMMTLDRQMSRPLPLPLGYASSLSHVDDTWHVRILAHDDTLAASGYAARHDQTLIYDRIVTMARTGVSVSAVSSCRRYEMSDRMAARMKS